MADRSPLRIREIEPDSPSARRLRIAFGAEMKALYAGEAAAGQDPNPTPPEHFKPPRGRFLGAEADGELVGCGGVRLLEPALAEVKRFYVTPQLRGKGHGRRLLAALEDAAREMGCDRVRLDCGYRQKEAQALYLSCGYRRIPAYNDGPLADFWAEKSLGPCSH
jgi:GNAT superfamily N-acetyltransferase